MGSFLRQRSVVKGYFVDHPPPFSDHEKALLGQNGSATADLRSEDWPYKIPLQLLKHFGSSDEDYMLYPPILDWCHDTFKARWAFLREKHPRQISAVLVVESLVDYMMWKMVWGAE